MGIYTIDQQGEGNITGVTVEKIKKFSGGNGASEAIPATILEVQNTISPVTENKKYITLFNLWKWFEKINVPQILLNSNAVTTTDKDVNNFSQNGKSVIIDALGNSTITISSSSEANFIALYIKYQSGNLTFNAGSGVTIVQANGTNVITPNMRAVVSRVGTSNTFILYA